MIRKHSQFFASMLWLFDVATLVASFLAAYLLRFRVFSASGEVSSGDTALQLSMAVGIFSIVFRSSGLYQSHRLQKRADEIFQLFQATGLSLLLLVAATYFFRDDRYSRRRSRCSGRWRSW